MFPNFFGFRNLGYIFRFKIFFKNSKFWKQFFFIFARIYDLIQRMNHTLHVIKEFGGELMDVVHDIHATITQRQGNFIVTCIALVGPVFAELKNILG